MRTFLTCVLCFSLFWTEAAFAEQSFLSPLSVAQDMKPAQNDWSIKVLSEVFGDVDSGSGVPASPLAAFLGQFNAVALVISSFFVIYTLVIGLIQTSQDGRFLGQRWQSAWIPARTAIGVALLFPKGNGYCVVQSLVMWLVTWGVGAADNLTSVILTQTANFAITQTQDSVALDDMKARTELESMLKNVAVPSAKMLACIQSQNLTSDTPVFKVYSDTVNGRAVLKFGNINEQKSDSLTAGAECGVVTFDNCFQDELDASARAKLQQKMMDLFKSLMSEDALQGVLKKAIDETQKNLTPEQLASNLEQLHQDRFMKLLTLYLSDCKEIVLANLLGKDPNSPLGRSADLGWWALGQNYQLFLVRSKNAGDSLKDLANVMVMQRNQPKIDVTTINPSIVSSQEYLNIVQLVNKYFSAVPNSNRPVSRANGVNLDTQAILEAIHSQWFNADLYLAEKDFLGHLFETILDPNQINPIKGAQKLGEQYLKTSTIMASVNLAAWPALGGGVILSGVVPTEAVYGALQGVLLPILFILIGLFATLGSVLCIYLPLVPYLVFTLSALGWLLSVVESMVAAPIVALGLLYPEGHDVYGKAQPALMLMLNTCLRPALMVMGLAAASLLLWIGLGIFHDGIIVLLYYNVIRISAGFSGFSFGLVYIYFVLALVQRTYSLIYVVPDRVLRWVGDNSMHQGGAGVEEALRRSEGAVESTTRKMNEGVEANISGGSNFKDMLYRRHGKKEVIEAFQSGAIKVGQTLGNGADKVGRAFGKGVNWVKDIFGKK